MNNNQIIANSFKKLRLFCEKEQFKGWDPYDGLNSWVIQKTFLGNSRFFRLAWIQLFKRNPVNFRKLVGVKKDYNPKGIGLFLIGYCNLYKQNPLPEYLEKVNSLASLLLKLQTQGFSGACWGYNFDWQARAFFQPKYTPTVVATSFIAEALMDAYQITKRKDLLDAAISSADFILKDLNKTYDNEGDYTLSYSPLDKTQVYNAGLLGAKLISQVYQHTHDKELLVNAKKIVSYVCKRQSKDGSWAYGTLPYHQWIDNFHTGYNLECIFKYQQISNDTSFEENIKKGTHYYLTTFFTKEGISKYYNNQTYPVDIHAPAQLIITLTKMNILEENKELADRVLLWTIKNMQAPGGFFYYQKRKQFSSRVPYIRWAQSWMFYAFSYYLLAPTK